MTPIGAKLNMQPGIVLSPQKAEVKGKQISTRSTTTSSGTGSTGTKSGNGVGRAASAKMYGVTTSTVFREQTNALRPFNPNKVMIDHSGTRAMLNADQGRTLAQMNDLKRQLATANSHSCSGQNQGSGKYETLAAVGMITGSVLGALNKLDLGKSSSSNPSTGSRDAVKTGGADNAAETSSLKGMKGAKDSTTLRSAIETAEADQTKMNSELTQITSGLDAKKADAEKAKGDLECTKKEVAEQEGVVQAQEKAVKGAETNMSEATKAETNANSMLTKAEERLGLAGDNVKKTTTALSDAKQQLANASSTLPDGKPNPAYATAKAAVATAETNKKAADKEYLEANQNKENTLKGYNEAVTAKEKATDNLSEVKERLKNATAELDKEQKTLKQLNEKLNSEKNAIKSYENDVKKQEDLTKDIGKYDSEIKEQKTRLTELEKKDAEDLKNNDKKMDDLQNKILSRQDKIDTTDGKSTLREKIASKKNEKALTQFDNLQQEHDQIQKRMDVSKLINTVPTQRTADGEGMRQGTGTDGKQIYMIGAKVVDETKFKAKAAAAQNTVAPEKLEAKPAGINLAGFASKPDIDNFKMPGFNQASGQVGNQTAQTKVKSKTTTSPLNSSKPTTKAKLELLENGRISNTKIGDKTVSFKDGKFMIDGKEVKKSELLNMA